jgi:hypothetical protein
MLLANLIMCAVLLLSIAYVRPVFDGAHAFWLRAGVLAGLIGLACVSYCIAAHVMGAMTWQEVRGIRRRP